MYLRVFGKSFLLMLLLCLAVSSWAQKKPTISGYIKDTDNGESLIGASVFINELKTGGTTNVYGFYSITVEPGEYTITYSFLGYEAKTMKVDLTSSQSVNIELGEASVKIKAVEIVDKRADENVKSVEMSKIDLPVEEIKVIPVIFGETDIIKTIQLLPGIQSTGEGSGGFYVRGGGPDQNLILVDDAVVYNASHLLGFFSVFNADAVRNVSIIKGGIPAEYGGRLSSVLNVTLKEGNNKQLHGEGGVGIISSRLSLEGPIKKNKSSFMVAARRTYADVLAQPFLNEDLQGNRYYFYDLNGKVNWTFSDKDRVYLSGYLGRDVFGFTDPTSTQINAAQFDTDWGNSTATLRWNHLFSDKLFSNTSLIYNDYEFVFGATINLATAELRSSIRDYTLKTDFDYFASPRHKIKFGALATNHKFTPGAASFRNGEQETALALDERFAMEYGIYIQDEFKYSERLTFNFGLRYSAFNPIGPYVDEEFLGFGLPSGNTREYDAWESIVWYDGLEPRASFRYIVDSVSSIKGSFTKTNQYLHLASISGGTLPTDLWLPSSRYVEPQIAYQVAAGYFRNFANNTYETSVEVFYKPMENQIDFEPGTSLFLNRNLDQQILSGSGLAYGIELFLKKRLGKTTGWIGYTLSQTTRTIDGLNGNEPYFPRYDRRHDVSFLLTHRFNDKWLASFVWVYATGIAYSLPNGKNVMGVGVEPTPNGFTPEFDVIPRFPDRLNYLRNPAYHRGDISITFTPNPDSDKRWQGSWNLSVYNFYNRKNPYFIFNEVDLLNGTNQSRMVYFPVIPALTYNFKF